MPFAKRSRNISRWLDCMVISTKAALLKKSEKQCALTPGVSTARVCCAESCSSFHAKAWIVTPLPKTSLPFMKGFDVEEHYRDLQVDVKTESGLYVTIVRFRQGSNPNGG